MKYSPKKRIKKKNLSKASRFKIDHTSNNNSYFEESENNLYEFLKNNNFQNIQQYDEEENSREFKYIKGKKKFRSPLLRKYKSNKSLELYINQNQRKDNFRKFSIKASCFDDDLDE